MRRVSYSLSLVLLLLYSKVELNKENAILFRWVEKDEKVLLPAPASQCVQPLVLVRSTNCGYHSSPAPPAHNENDRPFSLHFLVDDDDTHTPFLDSLTHH